MKVNIKNCNIVAEMSLDEAEVIYNLLGRISNTSYRKEFPNKPTQVDTYNLYGQFKTIIHQAKSLYGVITPKVGHHYIDANKDHIVILSGHFVTSGLSDKKNFFTYAVIGEDLPLHIGQIDKDFMAWFKSLTPYNNFREDFKI